MGYEYFEPERTWSWEELDELTGHVEGVPTWNMKAYMETVRLGYDTVIYDPLDYAQFVKAPKEYIRNKFSHSYAEETFRSSDMDRAVRDSLELLGMEGLPLYGRSYELSEYKHLLDSGYLALTWVDSAVVCGVEGECWPHFILAYAYDDKGIYAHDPGGDDPEGQMPDRFIDWDTFEAANKINDKGERGELLAFRKIK